MRELVQSMIESLQSPARAHAMMVHLPIAGVMLGLMLVFALTITRGRSVGLRWAAFLTLLATTAGAIIAWQSGERAEGAINASLTSEAMDVLDQHYKLGERAWIPIAVATALLLITLVRIVAIRMIGLVLTMIALVVALGWVSATAHLGGKLVYVHGVGVPASENNEQPPKPAIKAERSKTKPDNLKAGEPHDSTVSPTEESPAKTQVAPKPEESAATVPSESPEAP